MSASSTANSFLLYKAAAGWIVRKYFLPFETTALPLLEVIELPPSRDENAVRPRTQITFGAIIAICLSRYGLQALISSSFGTRFSGGRHFTTLVIKTSERLMPAF